MQFGEEHPLVIAQGGPLDGERWVLEQPLIIGRDSGCDIVILDRQVSRYHARITPTPEGIILEDMDSRNGTHYNGTLLQNPVVLQDGDLIHVALAQQLIYLASDATMPLIDKPTNHGRLMLDIRSRRVWIKQQQLVPPLSAQQFKLLWTLYENQGQVVSRPNIIAQVWGDAESVGVSDQALDALIRRLRDRLATLDPTHQFVVTVRGHGLRLDNPKE